MIKHSILGGLLAAALAVGAAQAAILDDPAIGVDEAMIGSPDASEEGIATGEVQFDEILEELVVDEPYDETIAWTTCFDCGVGEPGPDEVVITGAPAPVPLPAAGMLLLGGLGALGWMRRRR